MPFPFTVHILSFLCILAFYPANAQVKMEINMDKELYLPGDTIHFNCRIPVWQGSEQIATLNLWIENTTHTNLWKLRYPILSGVSEGDLVLPADFPSGQYAFYFQMQDEFWGLYGSFPQFYKNPTVDYTLLLENKDIVGGSVPVAKNGTFKLPRHVFPGQAKLFFTEVKKSKFVNNEIDVSISTPLDSGFVPVDDTLLLLNIGVSLLPGSKPDYRMDTDVFLGKKGGTLENVDVVAKQKTRVEEFDEKVSTGLFRGQDAYIYSGLDGEFGAFFSIIDYMVGRVPGFQAIRQPPGLDYLITLRGETPSFFLDEIPVFVESIAMVPVNDIALVKVFRTTLVRSYVGGSGGVIAIYTKRGGGLGAKRFQNSFPVNGYTPLVFTLLP